MKTGDSWTMSDVAFPPLPPADSIPPEERGAAEAPDRTRALLWASLVTGLPDLKYRNPEEVEANLLQWWAGSGEKIYRKLPDFPEPFRTTRFRREIRFIISPLSAMAPAFDSLRAGESSFWETMAHIGRSFGWDMEKLRRWKRGMEDLAGLAAWTRSFLPARDYLAAAFPLGREEIDSERESLLERIDASHRFIAEPARREFDAGFLAFKRRYVEAYFALHEDALHVVGGDRRDEIRIDPVSLRNLDLLSGLQHMDKRYLNRVKLLAKWVQRNQCSLPLREILETYPRCYCNFNPCSRQQPADAAALIHATIQEGIEFFRTHLRRCGHLIMVEVQAQKVEDHVLQPITALLSDGPMVPLKPHSIRLLNRIISKYPNEFVAEFRRS